MTIRSRHVLSAAAVLATVFGEGSQSALGGSSFWVTFVDPAGDAVPRRTDVGADNPLDPATQPPDLITLKIGGWQPVLPSVDPYTGQWIDGDGASILRLDMTFAGLVNPPGTLGLGGQPYDPLKFGPSPFFGFIELDLDDDDDTGGELGNAAITRYLANVARFGALPEGPISQRCALSALDYNSNFYSLPQYERSGADFAITMCGCFPVTIVNKFGDLNNTFDAGDTWIVSGRFFQRSGGYQGASGVWGGSAPGLYDPIVKLRFSHSTLTNTTVVSLVYALDMVGASLLTGQPLQAMDSNVGNHTSVAEALQDIIDGASEPLSGPVRYLTERWAGDDVEDFLDPTDWQATMLLATAYPQMDPGGALYVWTDIGFDNTVGDFNADGLVGVPDSEALALHIAANDGGTNDCDGSVNGQIAICNFAWNFSLFDASFDGLVTLSDLDIPPGSLPGDTDGNCEVNSIDLNILLINFGMTGAAWDDGDFDGDGDVDSTDLNILLSNFGAVCNRATNLSNRPRLRMMSR